MKKDAKNETWEEMCIRIQHEANRTNKTITEYYGKDQLLCTKSPEHKNQSKQLKLF